MKLRYTVGEWGKGKYILYANSVAQIQIENITSLKIKPHFFFKDNNLLCIFCHNARKNLCVKPVDSLRHYAKVIAQGW